MLIHYPSESIVCGVDEAGRGCIAGPVVAAAVILPKGFQHPLINDSKKVLSNDFIGIANAFNTFSNTFH